MDKQEGGGVLEVLLVNAHGIRHTNLVGRPSYYVVIQCGDQLHRSKLSSAKDEKACWNEKFRFDLSVSDCKSSTHLKLNIMDKEFFSDGGFVGQTIIHIGAIISEGSKAGYLQVRPAPYNVLLDDDSYRGVIKIGFKYITYKEMEMQMKAKAKELPERIGDTRHSMCRSIRNLWKLSWWSFLLFSSNKKECANKAKEI